MLLRPHRSYLHVLRPLLERDLVKGMAHITGGGITENLPRALPEGTCARIERGTWAVPAIFTFLEEAGRVPQDEMYRAFNMGVGLIVVCEESAVERALAQLAAAGEPGARVIGRIQAGSAGVVYDG